MPRLAFKLADREAVKLIPECMLTKTQNNQNRGPVRDLWDMPVNLDVTRAPVISGLGMLFVSAIVLLLFRVLWGLIAGAVPNWLRISFIVVWVLLNLFGLLGMGLVVLFLQPTLGFHWVLSCALFGITIVAFRAEQWVGLAILGALAVVSGGLALGVSVSDFSGAVIPISIVLLIVATILGFEWMPRKLLRLA
jgi:hypothetical protein